MILKLLLILVGVYVAGLVTTVLMRRVIWHNEGTVVAGEFYRSSQLNETDLRNEIDHLHIKSVINLRGRNSQSSWYLGELKTCRELGLRHEDISLSARSLPRPAEIQKLLQLFAILPTPILVHCNAGSDRTGLAGSLYLIERKNVSPTQAAEALSWRFGHFAVYPYFEMDEFIQLYEEENSAHRTLHDWVRMDYPKIYAQEAKETRWQEMLEPLKSVARIAYWPSSVAP